MYPKDWNDFLAMHKAGTNAPDPAERWVICNEDSDYIALDNYDRSNGTVYFDPVHNVYHSFKTRTKEISLPRAMHNGYGSSYEDEKTAFYTKQEQLIDAQRACYRDASKLGFLVPDHNIVTFTCCREASEEGFSDYWHARYKKNELHVQGIVTTTHKINGLLLCDLDKNPTISDDTKKKIFKLGKYEAILFGCLMQDWDRNTGNIIVTDVNATDPKTFCHFDFEYALADPLESTVNGLIDLRNSKLEAKDVAILKCRFLETAMRIVENPYDFSAAEQAQYDARIKTALARLNQYPA